MIPATATHPVKRVADLLPWNCGDLISHKSETRNAAEATASISYSRVSCRTLTKVEQALGELALDLKPR